MSTTEQDLCVLISYGKGMIEKAYRFIIPAQNKKCESFVIGSILVLRVEFKGAIVCRKRFFKSFYLLKRFCFFKPCNCA